MPERMPEDLPERMPEDMPKRMSENNMPANMPKESRQTCEGGTLHVTYILLDFQRQKLHVRPPSLHFSLNIHTKYDTRIHSFS